MNFSPTDFDVDAEPMPSEPEDGVWTLGDDLTRFLASVPNGQTMPNGRFAITGENGQQIADPGDYVIKWQNGTCSIMKKGLFEELFERDE